MSCRKTSNILIPKILSHRISQKEKDVVSVQRGYIDIDPSLSLLEGEGGSSGSRGLWEVSPGREDVVPEVYL